MDAHSCSLKEILEFVNGSIPDLVSTCPNLFGVVLCLGSSDCDSSFLSEGEYACVFKKLVRLIRKTLGVTRLVICTILPRNQPINVTGDQFAKNVSCVNDYLKKYCMTDRSRQTYFYFFKNRYNGSHFWQCDGTGTAELHYALYNAVQKLDNIPLGLPNRCILPQSRNK